MILTSTTVFGAASFCVANTMSSPEPVPIKLIVLNDVAADTKVPSF